MPRALTILFLVALMVLPAAAQVPVPTAPTLDKVSFGVEGAAVAEQGGFFQALADGTYRSYGLDVTIVPSGAGSDSRAQLRGGKIDFLLAADTMRAFDAVTDKAPVVAIAAIFQKEPLALLMHPAPKGAGPDDFKMSTLFVPKGDAPAYLRWLKSERAFADVPVKMLAPDMSSFIAEKTSAMVGNVMSAPLAVEQAGKFKPGVVLLADRGYSAYAGLIQTRASLIDRKPDVVQRFVDASLIGWTNYLYGNPKAGNALLIARNPHASEARLKDARARMLQFGLIDSGDAQRDGIGAMSDDRMADFFTKMVRAGAVRRDVDYRKAYTLRFINKAVGLDLRPGN